MTEQRQLVVMLAFCEDTQASGKTALYVPFTISMGQAFCAWRLPGREVPPGKDPKAVAIRVTREFTGLRVENVVEVNGENHVFVQGGSTGDRWRVFAGLAPSIATFDAMNEDEEGVVYNQLFPLNVVCEKIRNGTPLNGHEIYRPHLLILQEATEKLLAG